MAILLLVYLVIELLDWWLWVIVIYLFSGFDLILGPFEIGLFWFDCLFGVL